MCSLVLHQLEVRSRNKDTTISPSERTSFRLIKEGNSRQWSKSLGHVNERGDNLEMIKRWSLACLITASAGKWLNKHHFFGHPEIAYLQENMQATWFLHMLSSRILELKNTHVRAIITCATFYLHVGYWRKNIYQGKTRKHAMARLRTVANEHTAYLTVRQLSVV